ncbi:MAG: alpha/beta fold hydrolase, partial [Pseudomonadota bacterium]
MRTRRVELDDGHVTVDAWRWDERERPTLLLLPSLGRGAADFAAVADALATRGLRCLALNPRGIADSAPAVSEATLVDYARDAAGVIAATGARAHVVGHAFGNRVARCLAQHWPARVDSVTL